jgi:ribosome maturation factor RimP
LANIEERVEKLVKNPIEKLGYTLYDVQYVKEGKDYFLRVFINNEENSISLEDCEKVNNEIEPLLDTADYIKEQYFLEVSSTGIEKLIRKPAHLEENINQVITVNLFKPVNGSKEFVGILKKFDNEIIYLQVNEEIIELERKNISLMKTYYDWDNA